MDDYTPVEVFTADDRTFTVDEHVATAAFTADEVADADFRAVARPTLYTTLPENASRGDLIQLLARQIPTNEFGLPIYIHRSDLLDSSGASHRGMISQEEADCATTLLYYNDGYPTLDTGAPFWVQMPHEPHLQHILFKQFLALNETDGIRLLDTLARNEQVPLEQIQEASKEFYWSARARAYDLFIVAAEAKKREALTRKTENSHYQQAGKILDRLAQKIEAEADEFFDKLDPKQVLDTMEQYMKIQRLSLGLTGQNASTTNKEMAPASSVEVILRNLTKNIGSQGNAQGGSIQDRLALLMADEATALTAQELIVRVNGDNLANSTST